MKLSLRTIPVLLAPLALAHSAASQEEGVIEQEQLEEMTDEIRGEIEEIRDASFPRPVKVAVADQAEFLEYVRVRMEKSVTPEQLAADETVAKLMGTIPPDMDMVATLVELLEEQVGGFYDPDEEAFYLMRRFGGGLARIILAHELTHALDDQLYDIDGVLAERDGNTDAQFAFQAVVEGSGTAVMNLWTMKHLSELDPKELLEASNMGAEQLEKAPPFLWKPLVAVYLRGASFLNRTDNILAGSQKLPELEDFQAAFTDPPRSSEQILHPEKYWSAERDEPIPVELGVEALPEGWEVLREDTLGEIGWSFVVEPLKERKGMKGMLGPITAKYTSPATEGWGGDRFLLLGRGDARVLVAWTVWDDADELRQFAGALEDVAEHLDETARATAAARGLEGAGTAIVRAEAGNELGLRAWIGVEAEEAEAVLAGIRVRTGDEVREQR